MTPLEISPEVFTTDYVGEPGKRTFYLQVRGTSGTLSFLAEKDQVAVLAEKLRELLVLIDETDSVLAATPARDPSLEMNAPTDPEWRVGAIGLAYEEDDDRVVVLVQASEGGEEMEPEEESAVKLSLRREQVRAFVAHAIAVVGEGRPLCQLCGLPMDPSGHNCPASNGHRLGG